jgi:hypothetical protein
MDVLKDLFSMLAAAGLVFPHLGIILIGSGVVLICVGTIFWRLATVPEEPSENLPIDNAQREQTPLPSPEPARYRPDLGSSDGRERRPNSNTSIVGRQRSGPQRFRTSERPHV